MSLAHLYQHHLNQVSRSFAFCIPRLEGDLRHLVALSYLLFRIVDTVEDAPWKTRQEQLQMFDLLLDVIQDPNQVKKLTRFYERFPEGTSPSEIDLLKDSVILFEDLHSLPAFVKDVIRQGLIDMIRGMIHFTSKVTKGLNTPQELNQYCFFVAGIVGELLTQLAQLTSPHCSFKSDVLLHAHHFGLFLQKINILKDQGKDEKEGRLFLPRREAVLASLENHSHAAFEYIAAIPLELRSYRLFCAFSFFLGIYSLPWIEKSWFSKVMTKIPRGITELYLDEVESKIDDNDALRELFVKNYSQLTKVSPPAAVSTSMNDDFSWFNSCYSKKLSQSHLQNLGLV